MSGVPVIDAAQAASWDERARTEARIPSRVLMEAAGRGVADVVGREFGSAFSAGVLLVAGHGNNGGDGWVVARVLNAMGVPVTAVETGKRRSADCEANRALALSEGVRQAAPGDPWPSVPVAIDALLGTGASGEPRGEIGEFATRLAGHGAAIVAIDGPTGLDLSSGRAHGPVRADLTVTFGGLRRGHLLAREWCGRVVVIDIGFPAADPGWPLLLDDRGAAALLPGFRADMHKGSRGRVLVVGGEKGMAGAAHYAARAALAAGAGLVRVAAHAESVAALQASLPDVTAVHTALGPGVEPELKEMVEWADALVLGPGLGRGPDRPAFVRGLLGAVTVPAILDADALQLGRETLEAGSGPLVLTPHPGEFRAAFPELDDVVSEDRFAAAVRATGLWAGTEHPLTVLLKGVPTVIATRGHEGSTVVARGNPALATGGSGDLLSGFIGTFLARGLATDEAAALGAYVLGRGAEIASESRTVRSTRPADVLDALPRLWAALRFPNPVHPPILLELDPPAVQ